MHCFWLPLAALLVASLTLVAANEASQTLDSDLKTWSRLKRDAGYFTESGQWRGGFYKTARNTETEQYHCLNHTDTRCTGWNVSEHSSKKHETGNCTCKETASPYCQHWTCNTSFKYECGGGDHSKTCAAKESLSCDCMEAARNERYCWKWNCREDSDIMPGGYHEFEDYECVIPDSSEEFCFRWHGNTTSKYVVESSACQCFERGEGFCHYWQCRERGIIRCARSNQGWCRLEISIGVGGGLGLVTFAISVGFPLAVARGHQDLMTPLVVLVFFVAFCLPWSIGVVIWGGVFGFPWVLLMWSIGFIAISYGARRVNKERQRRRIASAAWETQNAQNLELTRVDIEKLPAAGGG